MPIDGLIILESNGRPIIQSNFRSTSSSHPLIHIDALNNALATASRPGDMDPVLYVQGTQDAGACCHVQCGDMRILCPVSGNDDPLIAFAFLRTFVDILHEYFGSNLSASILKENFDIIYQLLEETLDSGGHPLITSLNLLKDIVLPPSLLSKFLSAAGASTASSSVTKGVKPGSGGLGGGAGGGAFSSPIPWRKAGVRYNNNEIYFDIVEELFAVVNKHGVVVSSNVWGKVNVKCKLSGTPDLTLTFTNPKVLEDCSFHPCVRLQKFARDRALSFVPPDGRFVLLEYRYLPPISVTGAAATGGKDNVPIPFTLKTNIDVDRNSGTVDITLTSKLTTRPLESAVLELYLGEGVGGVKCTSSRVGYGGGSHVTSIPGDVSSSWGWDSKRRVLKWEIPNAPPSSTWTLKGSWTSSITPPRPAKALQVSYVMNQFSYSGLAVDQLKLAPSEAYKPYKGVKGTGTGKIEWRW